MKGLVFVELLRMAEAAAGEELVDEVLDSLALESGGAYSTVGSYGCGELFAIVGALSARLDASQSSLQKQFGHWMFAHFLQNFSAFFADKASAFEMLESVDGEVHLEVRKLYPDAELPRFEAQRLSGQQMDMVYRSSRPLQCFCYGLIEACLAHFGQEGEIAIEDHHPEEGAHVTFHIRLDAA
ncbi:heme NO-binding domain-containing protein [uncultured Lentibacter sp.]|jgi:hypothetical protein|uniref:heme NO-binding domain-containing protein n=1 Tax=uncultured Lentibacter sp. TaxID=1659309 RepID=UPI0026137C49|nr:heme NO-binding domain-containing protein [uncultured Lentibacter sp.]